MVRSGLSACATRVAEHFQPVRVSLAREQLGRALLDPLGMLTAQKASLIEKELQQGQVVRPQLAAEEKVVAEAAVEVLHHRTGTHRLTCDLRDGFTHGIQASAELLAQGGLLGPAPGLVGRDPLDREYVTDQGGRNVKLLSQMGEILLQLSREGQQFTAVIVQERGQRLQTGRAQRHAGLPFRDDAVVQGTTIAGGQAVHAEEVLAEPTDQRGDLLGQGDGLGLAGASVAQWLGELGMGASPASPVFGLLAFQRAARVEGLRGTIFQKGNGLFEVLQGRKDVAATRNLGQSQFLPSAPAAAASGAGGIRSETAVAPFQQTHAPGYGIAVFLRAEQIARGGGDVSPDHHRAASLKDLVVSADGNTGEVLPGGNGACPVDSLVQDIRDGSHRQRIVEEVGE